MWKQLRNDLGATAHATNYLLAVCSVVQSQAHGFSLLTPQPGHKFRRRNLLMRLRAVLADAKDMLAVSLEAGRAVRGESTFGGEILNCLVTDSAVFSVAESIASLQALYATTPDLPISFQLRPHPPLFVPSKGYNRESANSSYTRGFLGKSLRYGLPAANGRVIVHLDPARGRRVKLVYQPKPSAALAEGLTMAAARRQQVARLPGELRLRREQDTDEGPEGRAFYGTYERLDLAVPTALAVDPGSRTFATCLDLNTCAVYETNGEWTAARVKRCLELSDDLLALGKQTSALPFRRHVQKLAQQLRTKQQRRVSDMHQRFAQFLVDTARLVLLPKMSVARMVRQYDIDSGARRNLHPMAARLLLACRHGEFRSQVLASKLRYFPDCTIYDFSESYTTKSLLARNDGDYCVGCFDTCFAHTKKNLFTTHPKHTNKHRLQQMFHVHRGHRRQQGVQVRHAAHPRGHRRRACVSDKVWCCATA
jgi:hypothetical protein